MKNTAILEERNFLTVKELRDIVFDGQVSVTTINVMIRKGVIPAVRMGRRSLIPTAYAKEQLTKGVSEDG